MTSGRDDKTGGPAAPPGEGDLLTSEDIFGDMLDDAGRDRSAGPPPAPRAAGARKSPIKVKVGEAGATRKATPLSSPGDDGALPEDVAALLDAFSEPKAAPKPGSETLPPVPRDREPARPSGPPARVPRGMDSVVEDLLNLGKPRPAGTPTALPAPATARANETLPPTPARTATKFQAAPPRVTHVPDGGGIDLAGLAEEAMTTSSPEASEAAAPEEKGAERPPHERQLRALPPARARRGGRHGRGVPGQAQRASRGSRRSWRSSASCPTSRTTRSSWTCSSTRPRWSPASPIRTSSRSSTSARSSRSYYIAMEYVHGRDLRTILRRARERGLRGAAGPLRVRGLAACAPPSSTRTARGRGAGSPMLHRPPRRQPAEHPASRSKGT